MVTGSRVAFMLALLLCAAKGAVADPPKLVGLCGDEDKNALAALEKHRGRLFELLESFDVHSLAWPSTKVQGGNAFDRILECPDGDCDVDVTVIEPQVPKKACAAYLNYCRLLVGPKSKVRFHLKVVNKPANASYRFVPVDPTMKGQGPRGIEILGAISGPREHFVSPERESDVLFSWTPGRHGTVAQKIGNKDLGELPLWPKGGLRHEANVERKLNRVTTLCIPRDPIIVNTAN